MFNGELSLKESVTSLFPCKYAVEVIIINDSSTDKTGDVIADLSKDFNIISHTNSENLGRGASRNVGLGLVSKNSEFIAFMDADDVCLNDRLNVQIDYLKSNIDVDVLGMQANLHYNNLGKTKLSLSHENITRNIVMGIEIIFPSIMMRADIIENIEFNHKQKWAQDYVFLVEIVSRGHQLRNLNVVGLDYMPKTGSATLLKSYYMLRSRAFCLYYYSYPKDIVWLFIFVGYVLARQLRIVR